MNRSKLISIQILTIALVQIFAVAAFADPVWSGPGTTFQEWSFGTPSPTPPDDLQGAGNPYGTPSCYIGSRAVYSPNGGTWTLYTDEMDFLIPNNPEPQPRKEMEIEIDWMAGSGQNVWPGWPQHPLLSVYPYYGPTNGMVVFPDISILQQDPIAGSPLIRTVFGVIIEPNPVNEWVILRGDIVVDHIAISTICIPEPATLGLLIGGVLLAFKRRRCVK
jgi:hypothetical protein